MARLGELTLAGSQVAALRGGICQEFNVAPKDARMERPPTAAIRGGDAATNAGALRALLHGEPWPCRDALPLNGAAGLFSARLAQDLRPGAARAAKATDKGTAAAAPGKLRRATA